MRRFRLWALIALMTVLVTGCGGVSKNVPTFEKDNKLKVATSFYPLYEFSRAVGGEKIDLINLVPPGTEPHDWEPTAGHLRSLNQAGLFLYNGAGFEHWVPKTLNSLDNKRLVTVETSRGFSLIKGEAADEHAGEAKEAEQLDPHLWLDPQGAIHTVTAIRDGLIQADPANRTAYETNAAAYIAQLTALDSEFRTGLSQCRQREFFTSHAAFGYLAHRYDLKQHAIMGLTPDAEPKPKELQAIVAEARARGVRYIFFETLVSPKVANVVANEIGAKTLVLNPFEGLTEAEVSAGKNYLSVMRENLANLKIALECNP